ncbi:hypothetical protein PF005_g14106 [Phytophthora fragariae]|uniref:Uncharacterized protein n=1 Tax=Phytophthora fragariae TaxID=53985 RepID=A0A6A3XKG9_9STRA|nr:hypothetical protein PF003_g34419 [Phytophthora fragariae]KAE9203631.1 hypothetical protein PF005_g14106 [Phytophthora fragariae]
MHRLTRTVRQMVPGIRIRPCGSHLKFGYPDPSVDPNPYVGGSANTRAVRFHGTMKPSYNKG